MTRDPVSEAAAFLGRIGGKVGGNVRSERQKRTALENIKGVRSSGRPRRDDTHLAAGVSVPARKAGVPQPKPSAKSAASAKAKSGRCPAGHPLLKGGCVRCGWKA